MPDYTISCIIPTYNRAHLVCDAIDSALAQTYPCHEIIVVDDGSTDNTQQVLAERYGKKIRYIWQENQGVSAARNRGIEAATGEWLAFLDSDDIWLRQKLEFQISAVVQFPSARAVYADDGQMNTDNEYAQAAEIVYFESKERFLKDLMQRCFVPMSSLLVSREQLGEHLRFNEHIRWGEDWDFIAQIASQTSFCKVDFPLVYYRIHNGNNTGNVRMRVTNGTRAIQILYAHEWASQYQHLRNDVIAEFLYDAGYDYYATGSPFSALPYLVRSLYYDPSRINVWLTLFKCAVPGYIRKMIVNTRVSNQ